jgi:hypothetical protein
MVPAVSRRVQIGFAKVNDGNDSPVTQLEQGASALSRPTDTSGRVPRMGKSAGDILAAATATELSPDEPAEVDSAPTEADRSEADRRMLWFALGVALLPLLVSAIALIVDVGNSYLPAGDLAMTEMHVRDVGHHEVLVGLWSRWDWNHPGPALFYLLAPFYWLTGGASIGMSLGALVINGAAIAGMVLIARRRGGTPLMLCTLLGCLLLMRTVGGEFLHDPWNLYITVFPYALLLFLAWSMACGDLWAVPLAAGVVTFLVQTHVGFLPLVAPVLLWSGAALLWRGDRERVARLVRPGLITAGVLVLLWLPPLVDVIRHSPSNLTRIFDYFQDPNEPTNPLVEGWQVISGQFAWWPEWLTYKRAANPITGEPQVIDSPRLPWLLLLVAVAVVALWRRGRGDGRKLAVTLGLTLALSVVAVAQTIGPAFDYRLRWTWVPPMLAFVVVAWAGWRAAADRSREVERRALVPVAVGGLLVLTALNAASAARAGVPHQPDAEVVAALTAPALDAVDGNAGQVVVAEYDNSFAGPWYSRSLVLQLERHGLDARVPPDHGVYFSRSRVEDDGPVQLRLVIATDDQVDAAGDEPGLRLLTQWSAIPEEDRASIADELDELGTDWQAGRLSDDDYWAQAQPLREELIGEGGTTAHVVAVFVDER